MHNMPDWSENLPFPILRADHILQPQSQQQQQQQPPPTFHSPQYQEAESFYIFQGIQPAWCTLSVRQQPKIGRTSASENDKGRKPIDPIPVVQLEVNRDKDPEQSYLQSPSLFTTCKLVPLRSRSGLQPATTPLMGNCVSSLHRLKVDTKSNEGAYFVFGDLTPKVMEKTSGEYVLQFSLYEMGDSYATHIQSIVSESFPIYSPASFVGLAASTALTLSFCSQGIRYRTRKEPHTRLRKRGPASPNYIPRPYKRAKQATPKEESLSSPSSSRDTEAEREENTQCLVQNQPQCQAASFGSSPNDFLPDEYTFDHAKTELEKGHFQYPPQETLSHDQHKAHGQQRPPPRATHPEHPNGYYSVAANEFQPLYHSYDPQQSQQMHAHYTQSVRTYQEGYLTIPHNAPQIMTYHPAASNQFGQPQQYRQVQDGGLGVYNQFLLPNDPSSSNMTISALGAQYEPPQSEFDVMADQGEPKDRNMTYGLFMGSN